MPRLKARLPYSLANRHSHCYSLSLVRIQSTQTGSKIPYAANTHPSNPNFTVGLLEHTCHAGLLFRVHVCCTGINSIYTKTLAQPPAVSFTRPYWNREKFGVNDGSWTPICRHEKPTTTPTYYPTNTPSLGPTDSPTLAPSSVPTLSPTFSPTITPSSFPTIEPTFAPTLFPTPTDIHPEVLEKGNLKKQALEARSIKIQAKHAKRAAMIYSKEMASKEKKVKTKKSKLDTLEVLQKKIATKLAYVDHLAEMCQSKVRSPKKTSEIKAALEKVTLPPAVIKRSRAKVEIIQLIKGSLTVLFGLTKMNDANGVYALKQEAHDLVSVGATVRKLVQQMSRT